MSLVTQLQNFATRAATESKALRTLINGNAADLSTLTTTQKANLVLALNEVRALAAGAAAAAASATGIDDTTASTSTTYSSTKIVGLISDATSALVNGAPGALDTLKELSDALGADANFATTVATALANRLRLDAAQSLTSGQQAQGRANLDVYGTAQIGDPTTDFVAAFEAGLA